MAAFNKSARQLAFDILLKNEKDGAYSNLALDKTLEKSGLSTRDRAFVSKLTYGCIERKITLDYQIELYLSSPIKKLKKNVLTILRAGAYQILFMDKVPDFSAVNECVELAKSNGAGYAAAMINAILRKISSNGIMLPEESELLHYLSVKYSCPESLISMWNKAYGEDNTSQLLEASLSEAETVIRVNTLKISADKLIETLTTEGVTAEKGSIEDSLVITKTGCEIDRLEAFRKGFFHVQDIASQLCVKALSPKSGENVIDMCSAPGGKSFTIAEEMGNSGSIFAFDLYPARTQLIDDGAKRLGIDTITTCVCDSTKYYSGIQKADRVLCDVVCSGLGVIRRKPEIKYKELDSFKELPATQYAILENAARYVKDGGRLVYSTCTLNKKENDKVCDRFLENHGDFRCIQPLEIDTFGEKYYSLMPHINGSDGFFIAVFEKNGER